MAIYSGSSPYYNTPMAQGYLDILEYRSIPTSPTDGSIEILQQYQYRPDLLAYDLYGDVGLWWVFAVRNRDVIKDPIFDMYAGQVIMFPQVDTLRAMGL